MPRLGQETPRAPYLLCAFRCGSFSGSRRCSKGAVYLKEGYAVCYQHVQSKAMRLHMTAVPYKYLEPMLGDQFSRLLTGL